MSDPKQRREDFRIVFPISERPTIVLKGNIFPVVDLSSSGVRILAGDRVSDFNNSARELEAKIKFTSGKVIDVIVKYLRCADKEIIFTIDLKIPLNVITDEQIRLRKLQYT